MDDTGDEQNPFNDNHSIGGRDSNSSLEDLLSNPALLETKVYQGNVK